MALSASRLSGTIKTAMLAGATGAQNNAALTAMCDAIAGAVLAEITANAVVAVPGTGLTSAAGGGPVTGAAVGTVS